MSNKKLDELELNEIRNYIGETIKEITQNNSKYIIAYCRVSDPKQVDNYSISTQLNAIKKYAKENGFKIIKVFTIEGESSGKGKKRPSVNNLLEFIKDTKSKIHSIVVFHTNRFARDGSFGADFLEKIIKKGIGFMDLNSPNDIFNPQGRLRQIQEFYDAEQDNLTRKKFINATVIERLKKGYTMRKAPLGFSIIKTTKKQDQKVIINDDGEKLREAFKLKLTTNYSNVIIAEKLKALGLDITPKYLGVIFKNVYYCGLINDRRLIESNGIVEGRHKGIITPEEYKIINNVNGARKRTIKKTDRKELPLRKHIICPNCNKKITGYKARDRNDLFYYSCSNNRCGVSIKNLKLHDLYTNLLNDLSFDSKHIPQLSKLLNSIFKDINKSNTELKKSISKEITKLGNKIFSATENMVSYPDDRHLYKRVIDEYESRLENLKQERKNLNESLNLSKKNIDEVLQFVSDLPNIWKESDLVTKIKLQELIFPDGVVYNKKSNKLIPENINPIFNVFGGFKSLINSKKFLTYTRKPNQKNNENSDKNRTDFLFKNILINTTNTGIYDNVNHNQNVEKILLVVLLSDRSNNFANKLVESMDELLRFCNMILLNC